MMPYMSLCVVMINLGNLRDQIFPRTGFAPRGGGPFDLRALLTFELFEDTLFSYSRCTHRWVPQGQRPGKAQAYDF